jgi:hypothetical protein
MTALQTALQTALHDYISMRRGLGYKFVQPEVRRCVLMNVMDVSIRSVRAVSANCRR